MDFIELGKYLQEHVEYIYFNCIFSCTYGDSWVESHRGKTRQFIMWKDIVIWENGVLEINPCSEGIEGEVLKEIFELLDLEFLHALGSNNFDKVKDYYTIKEIKFQESKPIEYIEEVEDIEELEEVIDEDTDTENISDNDLQYVIEMNLRNNYLKIEKHCEKDIKNGFKIFGEY